MVKKDRDPQEGAKMLATLAAEAVDAFKQDDKEAYAQLVKQYDSAAAVVGVFGIGAVTLAVRKGEVMINPEGKETYEVRGRGAIYAETLAAIADGKLTVLDAYHRSELVTRAPDKTLHEAYDSFCQHAESALKSKRLRATMEKFRKYADV